jgi:hypothetical protein
MIGDKMYIGFELDKIKNEFTYDDKTKGEELYRNIESKVKKELQSLILDDGVVDGTKVQKSWFPEIEVDVFISHSHADKDDALKLAGWLYNNFKITSFIDSCVWGYSDDLLLNINNSYSDAVNKSDSETTYNYAKCNYAASHVYMMLTNALMKMIDSSECLFFMNTSNSIKLSDNIKQPKVASPWIYMELGLSKYIRLKPLDKHRYPQLEKKAMFSALNEQALQVHYEPDLDHLFKVSESDLRNWKRNSLSNDKYKSLDYLYNKYLQSK